MGGRSQPRSAPEPRQGGAVPIEVCGLHKRYGAKEAVVGVDLAIEPGRFVVLLGPSGSGKSTLVRCLAGIERVSAGRVRFGGTDVDGPSGYLPPERRDLAMVFQDFALWPHLTAEDNVAFALKRHRVPAERRRATARAMLERVGLAGLAGRYPGELSGGEQQRVALARALVAHPGLLLFDEPLSNLDADLRDRLRVDIGTMVREQGATAVYITHDQAEAFALADLVGVLGAGRLVQLGRPEEIYHRPADAFVARFTGLAGELDGRARRPVADPTATAGDGAADLSACTRSGTTRSDWWEVEVDGARLVGRVIGTPPTPGSRVRLLVRPAALRLRPPAAATSEAADGTAAAGSGGALSGVVREAAFRGWGYEHVVTLAGGEVLTGIAHQHRIAVGAGAQLAVEATGCFVASAAAAGDADDPGSLSASPPADPLARHQVRSSAEERRVPLPL